MTRPNPLRNVLVFLLAAGWVFLLLALLSYRPTDWPSHGVYQPGEPAVGNWCGSAGAFVAYWAYFAVGAGAFAVLFFTGVFIALAALKNHVSDLWLRVIGLLILAVAVGAIMHQLRAGSPGSLPEGHGGVMGIASSMYLQDHFNRVGTSLILFTAMLVGLILAADDLMLRMPRLIGQAVLGAGNQAARIDFRFPELPKLPALPRFVTRDAAAAAGGTGAGAGGAGETREQKIERLSNSPLARALSRSAGAGGAPGETRGKKARGNPGGNPAGNVSKSSGELDALGLGGDLDLTYHNDEPAGDVSFFDTSDPAPSAAAVIPPAAPRSTQPAEPVLTLGIPPDVRPKDPAAPAGQAHTDPKTAASDGADDVDVVGTVKAGAMAAAVPAPSRVDEPPPPPKQDIVVRGANSHKPKQTAPPPPKELGDYQLPHWDCLEEAESGFNEQQEQFVREKAAVLEQALKEFDIDARVVLIDTGPVITMYEIALAPGIKVSSITALSNDIARALAAINVRIVAPVPGKHTVGIEVPNAHKEKVRMKELMQLAPAATAKMSIPLYLGKDASGEPLITDLHAMPHGLIAGTTGSGKSVCINTIIMSIIYTQRPDTVKLVLVDPKVVEMAPFRDIPHLMCPVITETAKACSVLEWACTKMDERYELLAEAGVRNIKDYNKLSWDELKERFGCTTPEEEAKIPKKMPFVVIIIDELADLMMTSGKEVEGFIVRIAQKARAVGIHLILATQRPQATVVTGLIKSNMPTKVAFRVASKMDSRIVLDQNGAELLLGHGDMLFLENGASKPMRGQGTYIDDREIRESVRLVKSLADAQYEPELVQIKTVNGDDAGERDELFNDAVRVVLETRRGSVSLLQRKLTIGYARASRLIEQMAVAGLVGEYKGSQAREATITLDEWDAMQEQQEADEANGMTV